VSREMLINDDMSVFSGVASYLGQAAARTLDKDVYALFASNGPTMGDGDPLFHANHGNIAGTAAAPTMAAFEAARVQMASQMDPSGNDYLDIRPAIWLGPLSLGGQARQTNAAEYDDEAQKNQRRPNISRGLVRDIVDTPRLPSTIWYMLADPAVAPVFEVGFLDGVQVPQLEMEEAFRTDGLSWRIRYEYGVAAIDWRGIVKNTG
jgi:phage major head subunit gpT-like protein